MDELKTALKLSVPGPLRKRAVAACRKQLAAWHMAMPKVEPLVSDFGLDDFDKTGLIEYWIANEVEAGYCGKYMFVFDGQTCPEHRHKIKHETFLIVQGRCWMSSGRKRWTMNAGDVFVVPRGRYHSFTGRGPCLLLEVSMPCKVADNDFKNRAILIGRPAAKR